MENNFLMLLSGIECNVVLILIFKNSAVCWLFILLINKEIFLLAIDEKITYFVRCNKKERVVL